MSRSYKTLTNIVTKLQTSVTINNTSPAVATGSDVKLVKAETLTTIHVSLLREKVGLPLLFGSGIIPQVLSTQWTTIVNNRLWQMHSVDNSCGLTPSRTGGRINSLNYFIADPPWWPNMRCCHAASVRLSFVVRHVIISRKLSKRDA